METGAIAPSSASLSEFITDAAQLPAKKCVVELGSGNGVFTQKILQKISSGCTFFGLEIDPQFVQETKKNCPEAVVYLASAKEIKTYLFQHQQERCDCIISGLPWAAFNQKQQEELLSAVDDSLEIGGEFFAFAYLPGLLLPTGIRFKKLLKKKFSLVTTTQIIWKNLPPAVVYCCKK